MPQPLEQRVHTIAQRVEDVWRSRFSGAPVDLPVSAIAALTLVRGSDPRGAREAFLDLPSEQAAHVLRLLWSGFGRARPDLVYRALPLARWTHGTAEQEQQATLVAVARAAVQAGFFDLTMNAQVRTSVDVFGPLLMALRPKAARERNGQFYTPADVAEILARGSGTPQPGEQIFESSVGTGGLILAFAEQIRAHGRDPADSHWELVDIDPVAVACLAVNVHLWGLGPRVLIGCGDGLADDWRPRALYERDLGIRIQRSQPLYRMATALDRYASAA
ncbi:N-6 DNA methylase [Nocardiopsis tropica]|uniref:N-6 DNA methylase n=1 Tax=Nocardiopsis tropica TaxID=109330 RepID=A0ABU7KK84_9ACTN|nr:N-6 DNA methylase [Nocardiopsis umidischolae]MEE2049705.1 N-6 DNA methylase [Nocardiopsis umidischolae]